MSLFHVIGFGLNLLLTLCCWFVSVISMNWLNDGEIMTTKTLLGDGEQIVMKLWEGIAELSSKIYHCYPQYVVAKKWWRKLLIAWVLLWIIVSFSVFWYMSTQAYEKRKETLTSMCDERARMLQDQFNVSMNHVQAMSILISTFHHGRNPSAIDQSTFARYTDRTAFERPLTSGVAYAVRVLHSERKEFEKKHGWSIKRMDILEQTPVHKDDEYDRDGLEPSPIQEEYAPVIFAQDTIAHVISVDMLSGKEDRENVLRARESGKGVLTAPFKLLKTNRLGVIKTFAVYKTDLPSNATPNERIQATDGYLGGVLDIESLVEKLLQQLASKQTILVNVYDTTNISHPISMYGSNVSSDGVQHVSALNFGDPFRRHEMRCRFKQKPPWPWLAITTATGIIVIALLIGQIFHATINRIAKVEDDYQKMMMLKKRAEAADIAKSQFLATVSHEIRTPMNGVLGMLHMLMDTGLDVTQQDYVSTAQASGKALVSLINEVLDQAKIESGKLELEAVCFDVRATLDEVLSLFSGKSQEKGVELAAYISDKVPDVLIGDPGRFRQIITNLMGNSIKFTEEGHIFVTVHLVEEVIESAEEFKMESSLKSTLSGLPVADKRQSWRNFVVFNQEGSCASFASSSLDQINLMVSVEDTGVGIPLEAQSRIFTPFMQVGPSIARIHGGTGIGLSISKCLVHLMKGEIGFVSLPKIGSTFTFTAVFTNARCKNEQKIQQINNQSNSVSSDFHGMRALIVDPRTVRAKVSLYHMKRLGVHAEVVSDLSYLRTENGVTNMILIEQEVWDTDLEKSSLFVKNLRRINASVSPKLFILANPINSSRAGVSANGFPIPFVIMKPLRASMLAASLQRAMGVGNKGNCSNGELPGLSLSKLLQGRKILVVDDNNVNLRVAAAALKKYGADVVCTDTGKKALTFLQPPHQFDACFMDIQMPEMDGFQATKKIREMESDINSRIKLGQLPPEAYGNVSSWKVPILAMTADVIQATYEECQKCGMDGYVSKPFEAEQLYQEASRFFHVKPNQNT
ncbi:histidine kinase 3 [Lycium ferocissimum]|uniref:histidine kinase 3 n=1 Tax=Lycium ferocissimum TaxID=112874 RepID=UPI002815A220|nr:histidine kinase 3 [Lycium ferocissimum]